MSDEIKEPCDCPACIIANGMREAIANGLPPDLLIEYSFNAVTAVALEYGVDIDVDEVNGTIH